MPKLATECVPDAEGVVWTCALREGVTFHDGSAFDANDVVASWSAISMRQIRCTPVIPDCSSTRPPSGEG